jgi:hypothetical protein
MAGPSGERRDDARFKGSAATSPGGLAHPVA